MGVGPRPRLRLPGPGGADVWIVRLAPGDDDPAELTGTERDRRAAIVDLATRSQWGATRVQLRRLLGAYLDVPPAQVPLVQVCARCGGPHGQLSLAGPLRRGPMVAAHGHTGTVTGTPAPPIGLSVSHAGPLALLAVAGGPVGVDVELASDDPAGDRLAVAEQFTPAESAWVHGAGPADADTRLLQIWTGKEAYLKATGEGVRRPLDSLTVQGGDRPVLVASDAGDADRWALVDLTPDLRTEHPAAVGTAAVVRGTTLRVRRWPAGH